MTDWAGYLAAYHGSRPGITEAAFDRCFEPGVGTPHDWLAAGLPGPAGAVLDLGCGSAPMRGRLAASGYLGVDLSRPELALARDRGRGPVAVADARVLPVGTGSVDTVVSSMSLMLVDPLQDAVSEVARVLRPGGRVALMVPASGPLRLSDLPPVAVLASTLHGAGSMPQRLTPARARSSLARAGLVVDSVERRRFGFPLHDEADARFAVASLYTPGRDRDRLETAARRLARLTGPGRQVGVPLLRVLAHRPGPGWRPAR